MVHASLGLKSLSSFIRSSSQTHTESADGVSDLNYLLWAYKSWAAPGCCAEELGSGDTPGCFRRRCGSSRVNSRSHSFTRGTWDGTSMVANTSQNILCFLPMPALCPAGSAVPLLSRDEGCFQRLHWSWLMHESQCKHDDTEI